MLDDPLDLLRALFARVLLCDAHGRVVRCIGDDGGVTDALSAPGLAAVREQIRSALAGQPFEAVLPGDGEGPLRMRGVPLAGKVLKLALAFEPELPRGERLRHGGLELSEHAFLLLNLRQGLWRLHPDETVAFANDSMAVWLETTPDALVGTPASQWRLTSGAERYETEFRTATGLVRRALVVRSEVLSYGGQSRGWVEVVTDVTAEHVLKAKLVEEVRRMSQLARTDALTGLPNRHAFEERMAEVKASGQPYALVMVDLDGLKEINDAKGHARGDQALVAVAGSLQSAVRGTDLVARIGGDEFAVLLPNTGEEAATVITDRLRRGLDGETRASVGVAHSSRSPDLFREADEDMYRHKRNRRS